MQKGLNALIRTRNTHIAASSLPSWTQLRPEGKHYRTYTWIEKLARLWVTHKHMTHINDAFNPFPAHCPGALLHAIRMRTFKFKLKHSVAIFFEFPLPIEYNPIPITIALTQILLMNWITMEYRISRIRRVMSTWYTPFFICVVFLTSLQEFLWMRCVCDGKFYLQITRFLYCVRNLCWSQRDLAQTEMGSYIVQYCCWL